MRYRMLRKELEPYLDLRGLNIGNYTIIELDTDDSPYDDMPFNLLNRYVHYWWLQSSDGKSMVTMSQKDIIKWLSTEGKRHFKSGYKELQGNLSIPDYVKVDATKPFTEDVGIIQPFTENVKVIQPFRIVNPKKFYKSMYKKKK